MYGIDLFDVLVIVFKDGNGNDGSDGRWSG